MNFKQILRKHAFKKAKPLQKAKPTSYPSTSKKVKSLKPTKKISVPYTDLGKRPPHEKCLVFEGKENRVEAIRHFKKLYGIYPNPMYLVFNRQWWMALPKGGQPAEKKESQQDNKVDALRYAVVETPATKVLKQSKFKKEF